MGETKDVRSFVVRTSVETSDSLQAVFIGIFI